jgi:hypothetical protein
MQSCALWICKKASFVSVLRGFEGWHVGQALQQDYMPLDMLDRATTAAWLSFDKILKIRRACKYPY